jgi:cytochrome c553
MTATRNEGRGRRATTTIALQFALQAAILAIAFSANAGPDNERRTTASERGLQAKVGYCTDCHGSSGQGYQGFLPMPRLAGQRPEYFESQLRVFAERTREKDIFLNMAKVHGLSPTTRAAVAAHFRNLNPSPIGGAPKNLVAAGKKIYEEGIPEASVPACLACHGPDAKGTQAIPRLAGQLYSYTIKELKNWTKERTGGPTATSAIMEPVIHNLTQSQITAVAAYVSYLK